VFEVEALLAFEPAPTTPLPAGLKTQVWELKVDHLELVERLVPVAEALSLEFKVVIVINPYSMKDDSKHLQP
jgi:hypothetical protein